MREILFRGKRIDNGEWIEGYYFQKPNPLTQNGEPIKHCISDLPPFGAEIVPETAGQYTGLKDKNGRRIFEGDIVRVDLEEPTLACLVGEIYFTNGCYMIRPVSRVLSLYAYRPYCTVIGNIFDNPELLEEANNHDGHDH